MDSNQIENDILTQLIENGIIGTSFVTKDNYNSWYVKIVYFKNNELKNGVSYRFLRNCSEKEMKETNLRAIKYLQDKILK